MRHVDLSLIAKQQTVAQERVMHPLADVDEAGTKHPPAKSQVAFRIGDTITVVAEHLGEVLAYKNYPHIDDHDPRIYEKEEILLLKVGD